MKNDIKKICLSEKSIKNIVKQLGKKITKDYQGLTPIFVGLLKGCNPFMMDLVKQINLYCSIEYMDVSSYVGTESSGEVKILQDLKADIVGKDVILVDDILDTGRTLNAVKSLLIQRGAKSIKLCVLLDKPAGRVAPITADYVGTLVPNEFVVGYGLDYNEQYRNLPYIGVLKEEIYSK